MLLPEGRLPEHVVPLLDPEQARGGQAGGIGACRFEIRKISKIITLQMFCKIVHIFGGLVLGCIKTKVKLQVDTNMRLTTFFRLYKMCPTPLQS